ncbi:MAG: hypothetical protein ACFFFH_18335 [Candidatus Thorarchaeota archaeon]
MIKLSIKKTLIWILVVISLFGTSLTPSVSSSSAGPSPIERPQGIMLNQMHKGFLWMIRNMQSAGFTPDNVYYGVYDNTGSYSYPIIGEREREVTISLDNLIRLLNTTIDRLEDIGTDSDALTYLNNLYTELQIHDELTIYIKVDSDLKITSSHDRKAVTIFYDNDRSVIDTLNKIKNNESISEQPFSGDEIFTNVFMSLIRDEISGSYEVINTWNYEDTSEAVLLKAFIRRLTDNRWFFSEGRQLFRLPELNIMRTMLRETNSWFAAEENPRVLEYGRFEISQLIIDDLDLRKVDKNLVVSEYDYKYIEHHLLGSLVYNDTNGNGMMDIGVKTIPAGQNDITYFSKGDEAQYRFDIKEIENRIYNSPQTTDDVLEFGSEFKNVLGYLQPIEKSQDDTLFDASSSQAYNVDEISTLFHFSVNNTDASTNLKFDYALGEWNDTESLQGLGFCQLMASTVVDANMQRSFSWRHNNNTELNDDYKNSSQISRFRLTYAQNLFSEIRIDDIPYIWDGTEEVNAIGQLIPMNLIDVTYGAISSEADMIRSIKGDAQRKTFLYSVSYPKWDGKSITHDPTYYAVGGLAAETSGTQSETGVENGIPGFEFAVVFITMPMLVLIEVYQRKQR